MKLNAFLRKLRHGAISRIYFISSPRSLVPQGSVSFSLGFAAYGEKLLCPAFGSQAHWRDHMHRPPRSRAVSLSWLSSFRRYIFPQVSFCRRSGSLEAEPEMSCVWVAYLSVFKEKENERNKIGQRKGLNKILASAGAWFQLDPVGSSGAQIASQG